MTLSPSNTVALAEYVTRHGTSDGFVPAPRKRNDNAEWRLQRDLFAWWRSAAAGLGCDPRQMFSIPNGSVLGASYATRVVRAKMLKAAGMTNGVPDVMLCHSAIAGYETSRAVYCGLFLELKTAKGVLSPEQVAMHEILRAAGYKVEVARTLERAISIVTLYIK